MDFRGCPKRFHKVTVKTAIGSILPQYFVWLIEPQNQREINDPEEPSREQMPLSLDRKEATSVKLLPRQERGQQKSLHSNCGLRPSPPPPTSTHTFMHTHTRTHAHTHTRMPPSTHIPSRKSSHPSSSAPNWATASNL